MKLFVVWGTCYSAPVEHFMNGSGVLTPSTVTLRGCISTPPSLRSPPQWSTTHLNRLRRNQLWLITCHHCVYVCVCRLMAAVNFHLNVSIHWKFLFSIEKFHIFPNRWTRVHHPHHLRLLKVNNDCWLRNNSSEAEAEENSFMARKI